jgi:hypothetical protein
MAYLEAMGIPVWVRKEVAAVAIRGVGCGLRLGPGSGQFLLLCSNAAETAGHLAADISRAFSAAPVWAWPSADESGQSAGAAVDEHLFTTLVVFGMGVARQVFGGETPDMVGPARVLVVPGMDEVAADPDARMSLWNTMCSRRLVADP